MNVIPFPDTKINLRRRLRATTSTLEQILLLLDWIKHHEIAQNELNLLDDMLRRKNDE